MQSYTGSRAIVVGGSIGGLTTALLLRKLGFDVDVSSGPPPISSIAAAGSSWSRS
jgi:2,6-dihydroxypyridine 3-monooxygenase